jgi:N-hydroxyarylamine O-acetyltransferase
MFEPRLEGQLAGLATESEFGDVLRGEFGLNVSDQQIDECVAVTKAKGTGDAPHPFFA